MSVDAQPRVSEDAATAAVEVEPTRLEFLDAYAPELELLNRRWALQILVVLLQRPARFSEFLRTIPGLSKNVMVERLRELGEAGLVARHVDPGPPVTTTHSLTPDGEALRPHIEGVLAWAAKRRRR